MSTERIILGTRETSTIVSAWTEYLCVRSIQPGVAIAEICQYELLAAEHGTVEDEDGNEIPLPEYYGGKKVIGLDYGDLVGGKLELISDDDEYRFKYTEAEITELIEWIKNAGFKLNDEMITSMKSALNKTGQG